MPITKDTPKYVGILLPGLYPVELSSAGDDKAKVEATALNDYVQEKQALTEVDIDQDKYVEPAWDLYIREREVRKLVTAIESLLSQPHEVDAEGQRAIDDIRAAINNL